MKNTLFAVVSGLAYQAAAHATFQELWVNGVDQIISPPGRPADRSPNGSSCARLPPSNSPVTSVTSADLACNAGTSPAAAKCAVAAGDTVTVEMHQQPGDRSCATEAIGGSHYGPVQAYLAAVDDAASASSASGTEAGWFKVFADTWADTGSSGSDDAWGTKDLNACCGRMDVKIPADLAPGDYLLRAEAIALHAAGSTGGAQFYMTCYQLTVSGSGTASPSTVKLPGAYAASDPGILINIYQTMTTYIAPGPTVYSGGSTKSAGASCAACESTCTAAAKRALETAF